jgi:predicted amidophosphoribosyltransferase
MFQNSNIIKDPCPVCGKNLRVKPPCCTSKLSYYVCQCGYKKVKDEVDTVHHSGGGDDSANVQG